MEETEEPALRHWERKLLIVAFAGWAGVVALYGQQVVNRIDQVVAQMERERDANGEYHRLMERRTTLLEERQEVVLRRLNKIENHIDNELNGGRP